MIPSHVALPVSEIEKRTRRPGCATWDGVTGRCSAYPAGSCAKTCQALETSKRIAEWVGLLHG